MGLFDKFFAEFIDIIEWLDEGHHRLVWRFPRYQNEIKQGAELIVRPGQVAIFVHQGKLADRFEPGRYQLTTGNLPILSTLQGWKHGFNSPFRSEVYFISTLTLTDLKWGTPNPIMLRDPEFGPVRLRAFGNYTLKAMNPEVILKELVGANQEYTADDISELMRAVINTAFADVVGEGKISALELASQQITIAEEIRQKVLTLIDDEYGLEVPQLQIVNISFPEAVEKALDRKSSMSVIGNLENYQRFQMAEALTDLAARPGGGASGLEMGVGLAMAQQMMNTQNQANPGAAAAVPPPLPPQGALWHVALDGKSQGPFAQTQLASMISSGQVTRDSLVWSQGMSAWQAAGNCPSLQIHFSSPPPLK